MIEGTKVSKELLYGRAGLIEAKTIDSCDWCDKVYIAGLETDTSGEEYGSVKICFDCIDQLNKNMNNIAPEM